MVHIQEKKIIIEMDTSFPEWDLHDLTESLLYLIATQQEDFLQRDHIYNVSQLIAALQPTPEQLKKAYETAKI